MLTPHRGLLQQTFTLDGAYLRDTKGGVVEFRERGPQLTRGSRALKLWLSLRTFGLDAFKAAIAQGHRPRRVRRDAAGRGRRVGGRLARHARDRLLPAPGASDEQTDAMVRRAVEDGYTAPSTTILGGRSVARLCTINPRTTEARHRRHDRASSARALTGPRLRRGRPWIWQRPPYSGHACRGREGRRTAGPPCSRSRSCSRGWSGQDRAGGRQGSLFGGSVRDADRLGMSIVNRRRALRKVSRPANSSLHASVHTEA